MSAIRHVRNPPCQQPAMSATRHVSNPPCQQSAMSAIRRTHVAAHKHPDESATAPYDLHYHSGAPLPPAMWGVSAPHDMHGLHTPGTHCKSL
eukprot:1195741-Prorocentrum_minimum.AAC.2